MSTDVSASAAYLPSPVAAARAALTTSTGGQAASPTTSHTAAAPHASPVSLLDPSTGLVVLEFYNAAGVETSSLPTKKALENYRLNVPSQSVFQPAVHDGTVPQPRAATKPPADLPANGTVAAPAALTVQPDGSAAGGPIVAQSSDPVSSSGTGPFVNQA